MRGVTEHRRQTEWAKQFLLTRLMRGVTSRLSSWLIGISFLLTRLMRGVTHVVGAAGAKGDISTHTPHARRDALSV